MQQQQQQQQYLYCYGGSLGVPASMSTGETPEDYYRRAAALYAAASEQQQQQQQQLAVAKATLIGSTFATAGKLTEASTAATSAETVGTPNVQLRQLGMQPLTSGPASRPAFLGFPSQWAMSGPSSNVAAATPVGIAQTSMDVMYSPIVGNHLVAGASMGSAAPMEAFENPSGGWCFSSASTGAYATVGLEQPLQGDLSVFEAWQAALRQVEEDAVATGNLITLRQWLRRFLEIYPLCFGYWRKWAILELQVSGDISLAYKIIIRGLSMVPSATDLWKCRLDIVNTFFDLNQCSGHLSCYGEHMVASNLVPSEVAWEAPLETLDIQGVLRTPVHEDLGPQPGTPCLDTQYRRVWSSLFSGGTGGSTTAPSSDSSSIPASSFAPAVPNPAPSSTTNSETAAPPGATSTTTEILQTSPTEASTGTSALQRRSSGDNSETISQFKSRFEAADQSASCSTADPAFYVQVMKVHTIRQIFRAALEQVGHLWDSGAFWKAYIDWEAKHGNWSEVGRAYFELFTGGYYIRDLESFMSRFLELLADFKGDLVMLLHQEELGDFNAALKQVEEQEALVLEELAVERQENAAARRRKLQQLHAKFEQMSKSLSQDLSSQDSHKVNVKESLLKQQIEFQRQEAGLIAELNEREARREKQYQRDKKLRLSRAVKDVLLRQRQLNFQTAMRQIEARKGFESKLGRQHFHPKPLSAEQLSAWRSYLDFEISQQENLRLQSGPVAITPALQGFRASPAETSSVRTDPSTRDPSNLSKDGSTSGGHVAATEDPDALSHGRLNGAPSLAAENQSSACADLVYSGEEASSSCSRSSNSHLQCRTGEPQGCCLAQGCVDSSIQVCSASRTDGSLAGFSQADDSDRMATTSTSSEAAVATATPSVALESSRVLRLFHRCLVPCLCYMEFWHRLVEWLLGTTSSSECSSDARWSQAELELRRACCWTLRSMVPMYLLSAEFFERRGEAAGLDTVNANTAIQTARSLLEEVDTLTSGRSVQVLLNRIAFEHRQRRLDNCVELFENALRRPQCSVRLHSNDDRESDDRSSVNTIAAVPENTVPRIDPRGQPQEPHNLGGLYFGKGESRVQTPRFPDALRVKIGLLYATFLLDSSHDPDGAREVLEFCRSLRCCYRSVLIAAIDLEHRIHYIQQAPRVCQLAPNYRTRDAVGAAIIGGSFSATQGELSAVSRYADSCFNKATNSDCSNEFLARVIRLYEDFLAESSVMSPHLVAEVWHRYVHFLMFQGAPLKQLLDAKRRAHAALAG